MTPDEDKPSGEIEPRRNSDLTATGGLVRMGRERAALIRTEQPPKLTIQTPQWPSDGPRASVYFIGPGRRVAAVGILHEIGRDPLRIWDLDSGEQLKPPDLPVGYAQFVAGDDSKVLLHGVDAIEDAFMVNVCNLANGRIHKQVPVPQVKGMTHLLDFRVSSDGSRLASVYFSDDENLNDETALVWPIDHPEGFVKLGPGDDNGVEILTLGGNGRFALIHRYLKSIELWDVNRVEMVWASRNYAFRACSVGDDTVAVLMSGALGPGGLVLIDLTLLKSELVLSEESDLLDDSRQDEYLQHVSASSDGSVLIVSSCYGKLIRWTRGDQPRVIARTRQKIHDIAVSSEGDSLIVYCEDGVLHLYDLT